MGPMRREADFPGEPTTIGELMRTPQTTPTRDEAADFLRRLRAANVRRDAEYRAKTQGEPLPLLFRTTEFAGEVGELLNVVKKIERERLGWAGKRADRQMLLEEFGGVVATLDLLAMMLDVDLATATADEFNAVSDRLSLTTKLASAPAPASGGVEQNEKGPADFSTGPLRDHDPVATAATPVSEDSEPSSYSTTTDRAKPTPVSEAGGERKGYISADNGQGMGLPERCVRYRCGGGISDNGNDNICQKCGASYGRD